MESLDQRGPVSAFGRLRRGKTVLSSGPFTLRAGGVLHLGWPGGTLSDGPNLIVEVQGQTGAVAMLADPGISRRVLRLQILTVAWMSIEVIVALAAGWSAKSSALLGFGGDSAVELLSAIVVLWRFRSKSDSTQKDERLAARIAGALLLVVAGFVVLSAGLSLLGYREPRPTVAGIILLIAAAIGMPWLASQKRKLATQIASASLRADATESALCGYLSLIALGGLLANAIFHARWADPLAGLALVPLISREAWLAIRASRHCCA